MNTIGFFLKEMVENIYYMQIYITVKIIQITESEDENVKIQDEKHKTENTMLFKTEEQ